MDFVVVPGQGTSWLQDSRRGGFIADTHSISGTDSNTPSSFSRLHEVFLVLKPGLHEVEHCDKKETFRRFAPNFACFFDELCKCLDGCVSKIKFPFI